MAKNGLHQKLIHAFLLQIVLISLATLMGVYAAEKVLEDLLVRKALEGEAAHFWALHGQHPDFPRPNTLNMIGYLAVAENVEEVPPELRGLQPGCGRATLGKRKPIVYVEDRGEARLYLVFDEQQIATLSFYFGVVPLSLVLVLIYLFTWLSYRQSKNAISPIIKLAHIVEKFDFNSRGLPELNLSEFRVSSDSDVLKLINALDSFSKRLELFIEREHNFTREASHELRTPLAVIKSALALLQKRQDYQPNEQKSLALIATTLRDMEGLIDTLLLMARDEAAPLPEDNVLVNDLLVTLVEQVNHALNQQHIKVEIQQHYLLSIPAAEKVLTILFTNLLRNAFTYTREGMITLKIEERSVTVADTGIGMEQQQLQQVFEPFYRVQSNTVGHGLGLTIVKRLCDRFGWQLKISSKVGEGTSITVLFPRSACVGAVKN